MDILNFISWIKGNRVVNTVDASKTLIPVGLKDPKRDDGYIAGAISVEDLASSFIPPVLPNGNTAYGELALNSLDGGNSNTAYGYKALYNTTEGYSNTGIGYESLYNLVTGNSNIAIGERSLYNNFSNGNVGIGNFSLSNNTLGYSNVAIGNYALENSTVGATNVAIGANALINATNGNGNTSVGHNSSNVVTFAAYNTAIGAYSNYSSNFSNCIAIGAFSQPTGNGQVVFGSLDIPSGAITTETLTPTKSWTVKINGVDYKIPLQLA
jgi:hypothetical protein